MRRNGEVKLTLEEAESGKERDLVLERETQVDALERSRIVPAVPTCVFARGFAPR